MHQPVSKENIISDFLLRQLYAGNAMVYSARTCPINYFTMEALPLLDSRQIFFSSQLYHLQVFPLLYRPCTLPIYACPMVYIVEVGTS